MKYENQQCLGLFLLELKKHREKLLKDHNTTTQAHSQRTMTTFFSPITPTHTTSQSRTTKVDSQLGHNIGVIIDRAIAIYSAHRP